MAQKKITWNVEKTKETKGAVQYKDPDNPREHMIYLRKEEAKKLGNPDELTVTITSKES